MQIQQKCAFILWLEPFWIALLGIPILLPGKFVPFTLHPYVLATLFLFWPLRWGMELWLVYHKKQTKYAQLHDESNPSTKLTIPCKEAKSVLFNIHSPITIIVFFMLVWLAVNLQLSASLTASWVAAGYLLFGLTLYTAVVNWMPARQHPELVAGILLFIGCSLAVVTAPIVAWKPQFRLFHFPLYHYLQSMPVHLGETIHANVLAGTVVLVLPFLLALLLQNLAERNQPSHRHSNGFRILLVSLFLFTFVILVLTQSRGGYLAVVAALLAVLLFRWRYLLYIALAILFISVFAIHQVNLKILLDQLDGDGSLGGWDGRIYIWTLAFNTLHDFAYTGIGIGTFTQVIPLLNPLHISIEDFPHAHNLFLQIGVDLGLPGLIAYLALLINLFAMLITVLRAHHTTALQRTLAIGATGSLIAMLVHGLLDAVTWGTKLAFIPWLLFAFITLLFLDVEKGHMPALNT